MNYASSVPLAGFQFSVFSVQTGFALSLSDADSLTDLDVNVGNNIVIGFSLTGVTIPATPTTLPLATITVAAEEGLSSGSEVCLADIVASSSAAVAVPAQGAECPVGLGTVSLAIANGPSSFQQRILYTTNVEIAAFQFELWQTLPVAKAIPTSGTLPSYVASAGMQISIGAGNNIVVGFSLTNQAIFVTGSDQTLVDLTMSTAYAPSNLCIFNPIMSLSSAEAVQIEDGSFICPFAAIPSSPPPQAPFPPGDAPPPLPQVAVGFIASAITKGGAFDVTIVNTVEITSIQLIITLDGTSLPVVVASGPLAASYNAFTSQDISNVVIVSTSSIPVAATGQLLVKLLVIGFDSTMAFKKPCLLNTVASSDTAVVLVDAGCPVNPQPTAVSLIKLDGAQVAVSVAPPSALSSFELLFNVADQPADIKAVEASDNLPADFQLSFQDNKVSGSSSSGSLIPAAPVTFFTITLASEADLSSICFSEVPFLADADVC